MKTFKKFISEAATNFDFSAFKSLATISAGKRSYVKPERYEEAIDKMKAALEAKEIYKPEFEDVKTIVGRFLESVESNLRYTDYKEELYGTEPRAADITDTSWNLRNSKKQALHWKKFGNKYKKLVTFTEIAAQIQEALEQLKGMIVAGRKPKPVDPNKPAAFVKPAASIDASKKIMGILQRSVDSIRAEYEVFMKKNVQKDLDNLNKYYNKDTKKFEFPREAARDLNRLAFDFYEPEYRGQTWKIRSNVDDIVEKKAKQQVEDILSQFVSKNTSKLALLAQKKEITDTRVLSNSLRNGILENDMLFKFSDGSSFKIYSKVEYSQSKYGKPFLKFPTRFADVVLADGTRMKGPSEEKMIKEF
jgi:hypothetical protein